MWRFKVIDCWITNAPGDWAGSYFEMMFKKGDRHTISKSQIIGIVRQLRYLIETEKASNTIIGWELRTILSDLGIDVEKMSIPPPDK